MAAEGGEENPYAPIVTWVHSSPTSPTNPAPYKGSVKLEITTALPEGVEGEISIEWEIRLENWDSYIHYASGWHMMELEVYSTVCLRLTVTNTYLDEDGIEQTASTVINDIWIHVAEPSRLQSWWNSAQSMWENVQIFVGVIFFYAIIFLGLIFTLPSLGVQWLWSRLFG